MPARYGIAVCIGIASANGVYLLFAVSGLQVIRGIEWLVNLLGYFGAGYLIFLGIMLLKAPKKSIECYQTEDFLATEHMGKQFMIGFMSGILNPKNMIFYLSLFTVMVSGQTPLVIRFAYAVWMVSIVFIWDCTVVLVVGRKEVKRFLGRSIYYIEKGAGVMLAFFGLSLMIS
jgi:threonine/homoserine/homoserine lactone efflux protein